LLLRLSGALLLRFAARQFLALLFQLPPRRTRLFDFALPPSSSALSPAESSDSPRFPRDKPASPRCPLNRRKTRYFSSAAFGREGEESLKAREGKE